MTLYLIAGFTIAIAAWCLTAVMRERPAERATTYPPGSTERRTLEAQ